MTATLPETPLAALDTYLIRWARDESETGPHPSPQYRSRQVMWTSNPQYVIYTATAAGGWNVYAHTRAGTFETSSSIASVGEVVGLLRLFLDLEER